MSDRVERGSPSKPIDPAILADSGAQGLVVQESRGIAQNHQGSRDDEQAAPANECFKWSELRVHAS